MQTQTIKVDEILEVLETCVPHALCHDRGNGLRPFIGHEAMYYKMKLEHVKVPTTHHGSVAETTPSELQMVDQKITIMPVSGQTERRLQWYRHWNLLGYNPQEGMPTLQELIPICAVVMKDYQGFELRIRRSDPTIANLRLLKQRV